MRKFTHDEWSMGLQSTNPDVRYLTGILQVVSFVAIVATFISIWLNA